MKFKKISNIILLTVIFFVLATQSFSIIVFANYTYDFENMTEQESIIISPSRLYIRLRQPKAAVYSRPAAAVDV